MSEEVFVISPEATPGSGGLADYTRRVVEEWGGLFSVRFLVAQATDIPAAEPMGNNAAALLQKLPARGGKVLLQYSAYGFDRFGYPRWLLRTLVKWKRKSGGRLVLMLHETWAFWPWWNKNYPVQQLHRRSLGRLLRVADAIFTTTEKQARQLRGLRPKCGVEVLPVGTNVRRAQGESATRAAGSLVLFGRQSTRVRTLRAMQTDLAALAEMQRITRVVTIGAGDASDETERALLQDLALRDGFVQHGPLAEATVSAVLAGASFAISEMDQHNIPKSSVFMSYAAHGLNILSPWADPAAAPPLCWTTQPDELRRGLSARELETRAENLRAWQERTGSWSTIAQRFANALQSAAAAHEIT